MSMLQMLLRESQRSFLRLVVGGRFALGHGVMSFQHVFRYGRSSGNPYFQEFSTIRSKRGKLIQEGASQSILLAKLERALKEHEMDEAWETYKGFKQLYGFPDRFLMANLINELSYSSDSKCLRRAFDLVLSISRGNSVLLAPNMLTKLALALSRAQIPVATSSIFRLMLEKGSLPALDVLQMIFLHLVKSETGTYLASNILEEVCYCFLKLNANRSTQTELTKPDVTIFNLVLDACVRFGTPLKGQQIIESMPKVGVIADAHTAVIIARLHEMNGLRDELKKFKHHVDTVPITLAHHYQQFYDSLLSLHYKFNDIDGASALLLDLCGYDESNPFQRDQREQQKCCSISIGPDNMKTGLRLQFLPQQLQRDSVHKAYKKQELIVYKNGKFVLSNKGLAKLIIGYKTAGRINELSKLLISIQNMLNSPENGSSCSDVIDACIYLGWLETAHDILDDLESEKYCVREGTYTSLLSAYYSKKMFREAEGLARQIRRVGLATNFSEEMAFSSCVSKAEDKITLDLKEPSPVHKTALANSIMQNMREQENKSAPVLVHEYNSSIYFFTKAKMVEDAKEAYRKMQKMKINPNASTFFHLISGYSSSGMYREITVLWGDIKRSMENQNTVYNRDLYELVLLNFLRGGYFERVMEVIGFMMENGMFLDKWSYKTEFLKFHRDLYRTLTASDAKDETQTRRIEHVRAFRRWVGIG